MNIDELESTLPNGLHDALIVAYTFVKAERRVEVEVEVDMGAYRSRYEKARLDFVDVDRWEPDPPHPTSMAPLPVGLRIDTCEAEPKAAAPVRAGAFAGRFFVSDWNAFIHFVAGHVRLVWWAAN